MIRKLLVVLALLLVLAFLAVWVVGRGVFGSPDEGDPTASARPAREVAAAVSAVRSAATAAGVPAPKQVLFGDLHVHTTFSTDAFMLSLPFAVGQGAHPPADACDFARFCSALDFWSINDHAEALTRDNWSETLEAIRACNAVAADPSAPDTVAFLGWEWTQVGTTPEDHYGHKNVVLLESEEGRVPDRPIAASGRTRQTLRRLPGRLPLGLFALATGEPRVHDFARYAEERRGLEGCEHGIPVREQPPGCDLLTTRPDQLFALLDEWGFPALVIPHGTTWGFYTPPGSTWDKQLQGAMHDPERQRLFEIYSGHGDSELYRSFRGVHFDADGTPVCPEPVPGYLPSCWRAGEIIRERCLAEGAAQGVCEERARVARERAAGAYVAGHRTVSGEAPEDWLDAGQCTDCPQPAFNYRPGGSAQYVMALGSFEDGEPRHFRMGFMGSSDNHFARPGTGYKEVHRLGMTEVSGGTVTQDAGPLARLLADPEEEPLAESVPFDPLSTDLGGFQLLEGERQSSYFSTGGLIAVHAEGRDRDAVWDAMQRREVYGTSGPRILLWFDLLNPPGSRGASAPMGSEVALAEDPIFQVRAVGSFEQKPGCPEWAAEALGPERLDDVCMNECYHPGDVRRPVTRIEVVRIRPQQRSGEDVEALIDDPWRRFACEPDPAGCVATFTDPEWAAGGRPALYYARAFEPAKPTVNGGGVRCRYDDAGRCESVELCTEPDDDCLAPVEPRAWSSPIWVDVGPAADSAARARQRRSATSATTSATTASQTPRG